VFLGIRCSRPGLITVDATSILLLGVMAFSAGVEILQRASEIIKITIGFVFCVAGQLSLWPRQRFPPAAKKLAWAGCSDLK